MAAFLGIRAGLKDARSGRPPYGWHVVSRPGHRSTLLLEGWRDVAKLFFIATLIDLIYEIVVYRWIYPGQALIVAAVLAIPTYFVVRGPTNRFARTLYDRRTVVKNSEGPPDAPQSPEIRQ